MLWNYLGRVFAFAFRRTTPAIDGLQVVAASALPAIARISGAHFAANASTDALAYIGFAAIAFVLLRLLSAPYFIWRDQSQEIAQLKHDLNLPERRERALLTKKRVKYRLKLASHIHEYYMHAHSSGKDDTVSVLGATGMKLVAKCGTSNALRTGYSRLVDYSQIIRGDRADDVVKILANLVNDLNSFLHQEIDEDALNKRLPSEVSDDELRTKRSKGDAAENEQSV